MQYVVSNVTVLPSNGFKMPLLRTNRESHESGFFSRPTSTPPRQKLPPRIKTFSITRHSTSTLTLEGHFSVSPARAECCDPLGPWPYILLQLPLSQTTIIRYLVSLDEDKIICIMCTKSPRPYPHIFLSRTAWPYQENGRTEGSQTLLVGTALGTDRHRAAPSLSSRARGHVPLVLGYTQQHTTL